MGVMGECFLTWLNGNFQSHRCPDLTLSHSTSSRCSEMQRTFYFYIKNVKPNFYVFDNKNTYRQTEGFTIIIHSVATQIALIKQSLGNEKNATHTRRLL